MGADRGSLPDQDDWGGELPPLQMERVVVTNRYVHENTHALVVAERDGFDEQCRGFARAAEETGREMAGIRAENERLRETLKALGPAFPSHHIDGEKGGRWIEYGDGDGYWDDGDVHTEDCPACALGRRIDEALGSPLAPDEEKAT